MDNGRKRGLDPGRAAQSDSIERELRSACAELDRRLRAGEHCRAEDYFAVLTALSEDVDRALELIYTEYVAREALGQPPTATEWLERFPQWRDQLGRLLELHELLRDTEVDQAEAIEGSPVEGAVSRRMSQRVAGHYEVLEEAGEGGMGVVYKARHQRLDRIVALKLLRYGALATPQEQARFRGEVEAAARLQHPNIVQIFDVGEHEGCPFLSMEFVSGGNLEEHLTDAPLPAAAAARLVATLADAVHYAHQHGVVHRDLKPANVLLRRDDSRHHGETATEQAARSSALDFSSFAPAITDFGLAKSIPFPCDSSSQQEGISETGISRKSLTQTGQILGSPSYMSPEQAGGRSGEVGPATDIYALGAILYRLITGRPPFQGDSLLDLLEQTRSHDPVPPRRLRPKLPRDLETICLKCLQKDRARRYASAQELGDDLRRFLAGEAIHARPVRIGERAMKWARRHPGVSVSLLTIAALAIVSFAAVSWQWLRADREWLRAEKSRRQAFSALIKAETAHQAELAERERIERLLYAHDISLAYSQYLAHNTERANQLLDACRPQLRHWEWHYLKRICNQESLSLQGHTMGIWSLAYSPDGKRIASGSGQWGFAQNGEVIVWDAQSGERLFTFREQAGTIMGVAFHPTGTILASASVRWNYERRRIPIVYLRKERNVLLWDLQTGQQVLAIPHSEDVYSIAFSPEGRLLALGRANGLVMLCDSSTGEALHTLRGHRTNVLGVAFSPDGSKLASASRDGTARIWQVADGRELFVLGDLIDVRDVEFSPDGLYLATITWDGMINIWDAETAKEIKSHHARDHHASDLAWSPDGRWVVPATDSSTQVWNAWTGARQRIVPVARSTRVVFSPDARRLVSGGDDRVVRVWDMTRDPKEPPQFDPTAGAEISDIEFSPDGKLLALVTGKNSASPAKGRDDKTLRLVDVASRRVTRVCRGHEDWLTSVAFSADGSRIASGSYDKTVRVWHADTGEMLLVLQGHTQRVMDVAFNADGTELISGGSEGTLRLWNAASGQCLAEIQAHEEAITAVAWAPNGRYFISAGESGAVKLWNASTRKPAWTLQERSTKVTEFAFSRGSRLLASAGIDGLVRVWTLPETADQQPQEESLFILGRDGQPVTGLSFSPDGNRLAAVDSGQNLRIWDIASQQKIVDLRTTTYRNSRVRFSPDGRLIAISFHEHLCIFDSEPPTHVAAAVNDAREGQEEALAWHQRQVGDALAEREWFAALFHLECLAEASPLDSDRADLAARVCDHLVYDLWNTEEIQKAEWIARRAIVLLGWLVDTFPDRPALASQLANCHQLLARLLKRTRRYSAAIQEYERAVAHGPHNAWIANALAWQLATCPDPALWNPRRAVELARHATRLAPNESNYWNTLGVACCRLEQWQDGLDALERSIELREGGNSQDWFFVAICHFHLGDDDQARDWYDRAVAWMELNQPQNEELLRFRAEAEAILAKEAAGRP